MCQHQRFACHALSVGFKKRAGVFSRIVYQRLPIGDLKGVSLTDVVSAYGDAVVHIAATEGEVALYCHRARNFGRSPGDGHVSSTDIPIDSQHAVLDVDSVIVD